MDFELTLDKGAQLLLVGCGSWFLSGLLACIGIVNGWLAFFTLWLVGGLLSMALAYLKLEPSGKAVLVTGCDSGFGHSLALHLDRLGFRVFAGCLLADKGGEGAKELKEKGSEKLHVVQMNVTDEDELKTARATVEKLLPGNECLWAIVNNAGVSAFGNLEWVPISMYKKITDVNTFGSINVTKKFLPLVRRAKGRVINVASMLGRFGAPMRSPYVVSKFAVEGLSECLRQELKSQGVDVIVIEPGNYIAATAIFSPESVDKTGEDIWKSMSEEAREFCGEENFKSQIETMKKYVSVGDTDTSAVIYSFEEALTQKYPQARYQPMDIYYKVRIFVATHLPEWIHDMIYVGCLDK